jgi:formyltetrahydrofolate synthetase
MIIDVKQAVAIATQYFLNLVGGESVSDLLLEEVELSDDERFWHVTLSAVLPAPMGEGSATIGLAAALEAAARGSAQLRRRVYKVFKVDASTGTVRSMKMRMVHE